MSTGITVKDNIGLIKLEHERERSAIASYDKIADPLQWVEQIGKVLHHSGACGVKSEAEGKTLALACYFERMTPFEFGRIYHLIDGKPSMRSDRMLAEFLTSGGKHKWLADGSDGIEASLELTSADGQQKIISKFSFADAKEAGLVKDKSRWTKGAKAVGGMLRARCISEGIRMLDPRIVAGLYTPEEMEDERDGEPVPKAARATSDTAKRKEELKREAEAEKAADKTVDVQSEPATVGATAPFEPAAAATAATPASSLAQTMQNDATALLMELDVVMRQGNWKKEDFEVALKKKDPSFGGLESMGVEQIQKLIDRLKAKLVGK